jgi:hypothetical protein
LIFRAGNISAGSTKINICAPGSTTDQYLCAQQQRKWIFVLRASEKVDSRAPGGTKFFFCARKQPMLVLPASAASSTKKKICALGSTTRNPKP